MTIVKHFLLLLAVTTAAAAQPFERIVIPTVADWPVPGAFGSQWVTEITGRYAGPDRLRLFFPVCPDFITCVYGEIAPESTFGVAALLSKNSAHGSVLRLWPDQARNTLLSVRVRDLSRNLDTWGTELPIGRESEATEIPIMLLNLPASDRFRVMVRMYDFGPTDNVFTVRVLPLQGDIPLAEIAAPTSVLEDARGVSQGIHVAVLGGLFLPPDAPERVRLLIQPQVPTRFWAFASVTNNETQHVTAISPTRPLRPAE